MKEYLLVSIIAACFAVFLISNITSFMESSLNNTLSQIDK